MRFAASYDLTTRLFSTALCVGALALAGMARKVPAAGLAILPLALTYSYSPRDYEVEGRSIVVRRLVGQVEIPLEDIQAIRAATPADLKGAIRLWASGGLFGYFGLFRTAALGKCTWYVTNRRNAVVLSTSSKTVVFSPDDVEGFLAAIRASAPVVDARGLDEPSGSIPAGPSGWPIGSAVGIGVGIAVAGFVVFALAYSPGPPSYTLTSGALTIHDRFYPVTLRAADVDSSRIGVVDLDRAPEWQPVARTNGFANAHYQSGWFRTAGGVRVRLYRANRDRRLVLLPPRGQGYPVLLDVADPGKFLEEIRTRW